jgi:hypothetical protein
MVYKLFHSVQEGGYRQAWSNVGEEALEDGNLNVYTALSWTYFNVFQLHLPNLLLSFIASSRALLWLLHCECYISGGETLDVFFCNANVGCNGFSCVHLYVFFFPTAIIEIRVYVCYIFFKIWKNVSIFNKSSNLHKFFSKCYKSKPILISMFFVYFLKTDKIDQTFQLFQSCSIFLKYVLV